MKKLFGLLLPFCISCQNHDFDLAHLRFPITKEKEYGESNFYAKDYVRGIK